METVEREELVKNRKAYMVFGDIDKPCHRPECECDWCEEWRVANGRPTHRELKAMDGTETEITQEQQMGMLTHVVGFRPPDEEWKKMKAVYDACRAAGIDPPEEVEEFFDGGHGPCDEGQEVDLEETAAVEEWSDEGSSGYQVDLTKLPKNLRYIRFYNSW